MTSSPDILRVVEVGDAHVLPEELEDCERLLDLVLFAAQRAEASIVRFLGDQTHTHAVLHVAVDDFWRRWYARLAAAGLQTVSLVGNHDRDLARDGRMNWMAAHASDQNLVVDGPTELWGTLHLPYMRSGEEFVEACRAHPTRTVVCHQPLVGASYDSGAPVDGSRRGTDVADPALVPQQLVLSGHIHTPQLYRVLAEDGHEVEVWYPGSPRWRTRSDADVERSLWIVAYDDGRLLSRAAVPTSTACRAVRRAVDCPEAPLVPPLDPRCTWHVDVRGPGSWIEERRSVWRGTGVKLRMFRTDAPAPRVRESDGMEVSLRKFAAAWSPRRGTATKELERMLEERIRG